MKFLSILLFAFSLSLAHAQNIEGSFKRADFDAAKNSAEYIRFEVFSTKVGIFTSRVPGYALEVKAFADLNQERVSAMNLVIEAKSLDTDGDARDEKLHNLCLEVAKYPLIKVSVPGAALIGSEVILPGVIHIRGNEKPIKVRLKTERVEGELIAEGEALLSVSALEIPDPSIAVAKLEDKINIFFKLKLSSK